MMKLEDLFEIGEAKKTLESDRITVGLATCGISAGALPVFEALEKADLDIPLEKVGCNGMCYNEPIVTVVQDGKKKIYGKITEDNVHELIEHIKEDKKYKDNYLSDSLKNIDFYKKQKRILMSNCGMISPLDLNQYLAVGGYTGLTNAIKLGSTNTIEEVKAAGLRGRGGAGFSTGLKWQFVANKKGKKFLIANGDEGDPGAFMNRTLMESDPFRLLEGLTIASFATECDEGFIYTRAEYPLAIETLQKAIDIAYNNNLLGKNILGIKGFNFDLSIRRGAGAFVCGEETALIHSIEGKRGSPSPRPPYPAEQGVYGKPSNVNNVGTLGHVAAIMQMGASEYMKIGTAKTKGTKVICLAGKIERPGIIEVPMGIKLRDIVYDIGGGMSKGTRFKAVLTGGPAGGCIPREELDTPLDYESMRSLGSMMGSGGIVVISNKSCIVDIARYFMTFTQEESCGKCTPCREGTKRLLEMLQRITRGQATMEDIPKLESLAGFVRDCALCGLGMGAPNPVISTLKFFKNEYIKHIKDKTCPAGVCTSLVKFNITDKCIGCGACKRVCPANAIEGEPKEKHKIIQDKCVKCGTCYDTCPIKAIDKK